MVFKIFYTVRDPNASHNFVTHPKKKHPISPGKNYDDNYCGRSCPCGRRSRIKLCSKKKNTVYTLLLQWPKIEKEIRIILEMTNGILVKANIDVDVSKSFIYFDTTLKHIKV